MVKSHLNGYLICVIRLKAQVVWRKALSPAGHFMTFINFSFTIPLIL
jgi:hypothetical protein